MYVQHTYVECAQTYDVTKQIIENLIYLKVKIVCVIVLTCKGEHFYKHDLEVTPLVFLIFID